MSARPLASRLRAAGTGAAVGATVWVSQGALALVEPESLTRVGAVPSWTWLAGLAGGGAAVLAFLPLPPGALTPLLLLGLLWLPWLPVGVPGVFLLWEGPLEGAIWFATCGGVLWLALPGLRHVPLVSRWSPRTAMVVAAVVPALAYGAAWVVDRSRVPAGDEPHYLVITQSLVRDGDLRIENNHRADQYLEYFEGVLRPDFRRRGTDRQIYSIHAPGVSVLVAPAFAVAGYPGAVATVLVVVGLGLALVWWTAFLLTGSATAAWVGWGAVAASAPLVLHGFTIYPDTVGTAAVMAGVAGLVWLEVTATMPARAPWIAVGTALALLPWLHTRFALLAAVLGVAVGLRLWRRAGRVAVAALVAIPLVSSGAWFGYFWIIYGTLDPSVVYGAREGGLGLVPTGFAGLLVDQEFGLASNAPVVIAAVAGFVRLFQRRPRLAIELLAVVLPYLLAVSAYPMWWGGYSAPARFAVVVLPVLGLPLACWWASGSRAARGAIVTLGLLSAAISLSLVTIDRGGLIYNKRDGHDKLLDWSSPSVDLTLAAPSVHRDGVGPAVSDAFVWLVAGVLVVVAWRVLEGARMDVRWKQAASIVLLPAALMVSVSVLWARRDRSALAPATSQMAFLERWSPERLSLGVQLEPTRAVSSGEVPRLLNLATSTRGPRPRPTGESPLLQISNLPAGEYDVFVSGHAPLAGQLDVRVGRHGLPIETWTLDGRASGFGGLVLRLPVGVHSILMTGDDTARQLVQQITLKPRAVRAAGGPIAPRAARFGRVVVYCLDDEAFLEPGALWVRGERATRLMVHADEHAVATLRLQSGAVANEVTVAAGSWKQAVRLAAHQSMEVTLPAEAVAPATLTVTSATGFRPSEHADANHDVRWLGVYLTWRDAPR